MEESHISLIRAEEKKLRFLRNVFIHITNCLTEGVIYNSEVSMSPTLYRVIFQKAVVFTDNTLRTATIYLQDVYRCTKFHYTEQTEHT